MLIKMAAMTDGWNSKREASNNQHDLCTIDKKETIPGGCNSQGRLAITNIILALFKVPLRRKR